MMNLTKHHGLGNDFLVLSRPWGSPVGDAADIELARAACDRRRGIGADGLLFLSLHPDNGSQLSMVLLNADGSRAEMSGNGIRCLAQAAYRAQRRAGPIAYVVHTDAGVRTVAVRPTAAPETVLAEVDMGPVAPLDEPHGWAAIGCDPMRPVAHLSVGNPHSVVGVEDVLVVDLVTIGAQVPHVNLEIIEPGPEVHAITMRVHERGAGVTEACGTGACASAWAATSWGLVPASAQEIVVHMDGGDASVRLHHPRPGHVTLIGPATFVAAISF
jgi:diaminopimelate epimerase